LKLGINRQFNLARQFGRAVIGTINLGYLSNSSDDSFYEYNNLVADANIEFVIY
jgi:hypothetical protein